MQVEAIEILVQAEISEGDREFGIFGVTWSGRFEPASEVGEDHVALTDYAWLAIESQRRRQCYIAERYSGVGSKRVYRTDSRYSG